MISGQWVDVCDLPLLFYYPIPASSVWNGITLADVVFPMFLWTQGVSMALSFDALRRKGTTTWRLAAKTISRSAKLYALGCILNVPWPPWPSNWRVLGVLQYFSMASVVPLQECVRNVKYYVCYFLLPNRRASHLFS